jgi:hypothetical protein
VLELRDGRLLCVMRPGMDRAISTDKGRTWTPPRGLTPFTRGHAPYLLGTRDGTILCGYRELPDPKTSVIMSTDDGETWSRPCLIDYPGGAYPNLVELDGGRILCIYYSEETRNIRQAVFRVESGPNPRIRLVE